MRSMSGSVSYMISSWISKRQVASIFVEKPTHVQHSSSEEIKSQNGDVGHSLQAAHFPTPKPYHGAAFLYLRVWLDFWSPHAAKKGVGEQSIHELQKDQHCADFIREIPLSLLRLTACRIPPWYCHWTGGI